jgi:hypothetical protein
MLKNNAELTGPKLLGNLVGTDLTVSSAATYDYSIFEMSGRMVSRGTITHGRNTLNTSSLNKGMFIIRFSNGLQQWTDKFVRQ